MSDIFREIDEELRRDNLGKLWTRYGGYIIGLAVLAVVATGAVTGWRWYQDRVARAESVRYAAAVDLARQNQLTQAADAFKALASDAGSGPAVLARLQAAGLTAKAGDEPKAVADLKAIAQDPSVDQIYRDLATLSAALHELASADPQSIIAEVTPLTAEGNAWRSTALEITALAQLRAGDKEKAREIYKALTDDLTAPQGLRARAAEMITALSS
jgi:hypothetical protein